MDGNKLLCLFLGGVAGYFAVSHFMVAGRAA